MKASTKFMKIYYKLPEQACKELIYMNWVTKEPYSLNVIAFEVKNNTLKGKEWLSILGFKDG